MGPFNCGIGSEFVERKAKLFSCDSMGGINLPIYFALISFKQPPCNTNGGLFTEQFYQTLSGLHSAYEPTFEPIMLLTFSFPSVPLCRKFIYILRFKFLLGSHFFNQ